MSSKPGDNINFNLPNHWTWHQLNDLISEDKRSIISGPFGSNISSKYFVDEGIPVIRGNNLSLSLERFIDDGYVFVSEEKANELNAWAEKDDILFTAAGTIGQVGIIGENTKFRKYIISNKQIRVRLNKELINPLFAYYWLACPLMIEYIKQRNTGSTIPLINLSIVKSLPIPVPPISEQNKIVLILSTLDQKIALNRQTNSTLESIAKVIFNEWFVNFNFPEATGSLQDSDLGKIPQGWKVLPLDEIADFLNGLALQKFPAENDLSYLPVIKIRELKNGITNSSDKASREIPSKYIIQDGDLLFSWSGTLEVKFWVGGEGALNQHLFKVTSKDYPMWFCYFWLLHHLDEFRSIAEDKTTTMGHIQRGHISSALCLVPNNLEQMDIVLKPILEKIINNEKEALSLKQIRDELLLRLTSGKLAV